MEKINILGLAAWGSRGKSLRLAHHLEMFGNPAVGTTAPSEMHKAEMHSRWTHLCSNPH